MRNAAIKLGYFVLPLEEAQNIRALLLAGELYAVIDSCVGDGTALLEVTKQTGAHLAGIELSIDRAGVAPPRMAPLF